MKAKRTGKWIITFLLATLLVGSFSIVSATNYIPSNVKPGLPEGVTEFQSVGLNIINALMWIGFAISLGMLIYVGIKYVMSAADEKASMKGLLVKVVVGTLIVAGATAIVNAAISVFGG